VLELRSKVFLLENVKGLTTRRHRPLLEEQLKRVESHYRIRYQVFNTAYYGVPQRRERFFVLGIRKDLGIQPSFPSPTHAEEERATLMGRLHRWVTVREAIGDLLSVSPIRLQKPHNSRFRRVNEWDEPSWTVRANSDRELIIPLTPEQVRRIRREREDTSRHLARMEFPDNLDKPSRTISSHTVEGTKRETIVVPVITEHVMTEKGGWSNPRSDWGSRVMPEDKPSYTITEKHRSGQLVRLAEIPSWFDERPSTTIQGDPRLSAPRHHYKRNDYVFRRLTVRECLRLQSFPDWWFFPEGVSVSRKYKLVGEAVPPALAYRLAVHIGKLMKWEVREPPKKEEWKLPYFSRMFADYVEDGGD